MTSYRRILKTTSLIAGSSLVNVLASLVRMKFAAIYLGPSGVGLIGLFQNLIATVSSFSALGLGTVGTKQIAEAETSSNTLILVKARRALIWGSSALAAIGTAFCWVLREPLATVILDDVTYADDIGWLSIGVGLTVIAGAQTALLNGLRRIGDLALLGMGVAIVSMALGAAVLFALGRDGIVLFVLTTPIVAFALGLVVISRVTHTSTARIQFKDVLRQWSEMLRLGSVFVVASLGFSVAQLVLRTMLARQLGTDALGHFQATWAISVVYAGFIFQAMGADYLPRLASALGDAKEFNRLVNEQSHVLLLLAGPVLIAVLALAPWLLSAAYSQQFGDAAGVLRLQVLGDIIKLAAWPLGFINLVRGHSKRYLSCEIIPSFALVVIAWFALPLMGIEASGLAFIGMNLIYFVAVYWFATKDREFHWNSVVRLEFFKILSIAIVVLILAEFSTLAAAIVGIVASLLLGVQSSVRLAHMTEVEGRLGKIANWCRRLSGSIGRGNG